VTVIEQFAKSSPKAMEILAAGLDDVFAFYAFPQVSRRKVCSSNPIEHLNGTLRKRTNVVGDFPKSSFSDPLDLDGANRTNGDWITERAAT
jgi:putative transposase